MGIMKMARMGWMSPYGGFPSAISSAVIPAPNYSRPDVRGREKRTEEVGLTEQDERRTVSGKLDYEVSENIFLSSTNRGMRMVQLTSTLTPKP